VRGVPDHLSSFLTVMSITRRDPTMSIGRLASFGRERVPLSIIFRRVPSPQVFILQALRVRTMPILLSINPPFELLLCGAFGTVPSDK
jgi:hypothetical protein